MQHINMEEFANGAFTAQKEPEAMDGHHFHGGFPGTVSEGGKTVPGIGLK